jgi:hypothetical protein
VSALTAEAGAERERTKCSTRSQTTNEMSWHTEEQ